MADRPVTSRELAQRLGHSLDWLYRHVDRLTLVEGLPPPISACGQKRWDRASINAWLGRHHPHAPPRPANDTAPIAAPAGDEDWRRYLARAYGDR